MKSRQHGLFAVSHSSETEDPNKGIFTRRRSEIFLHRTRSGRARPDPVQRSQLLPYLMSRLKTPKEEGLGGDSPPTVVRGPIKDLRARRVFSPHASAIQSLQGDGAAAKMDVHASGVQGVDAAAKVEVDASGGQMGDAATKVEVDVNEDWIGDAAAKMEVDANKENPSAPIDAMEEDNVGGGGDEIQCTPPDLMQEGNDDRVGAVEDGVGGADVLEDPNLESTPPEREGFLDVGILEGVSTAVVGGGSPRPNGILASEDCTTKKDAPSSRPFRNRPGLVPCSRMKLFSTPNSHCYRRLLPYIMDLTKSNSSTLEIIPVRPQARKLKSASVERSTPTPQARQPLEVIDASDKHYRIEGLDTASENPKTALVKSDITERTMLTPLASLPLMAIDAPGKQSRTEGLDTDPETCKGALDKPYETEATMEISHLGHSTCALPMLPDIGMVEASLSEQPRCASNKQSESDLMEDIPSESPNDYLTTIEGADSEISTQPTCDSMQPYDSTGCSFTASSCEYELLQNFMCSTPNRKDLSVEELAGCVQSSSSEEPLTVPNIGESSQGTAAKLDSPGVSKLVQLLPAKNDSPTPLKGILKRPMIGCKGPCTCLDCASFRLNAERAFEFSQRQFLEADSVAEMLMKELSCLRKLVSNSVVPSKFASDKPSQVQVQDICRKACEAETLARNRMREMESDLNIHCRISRYLRQKVTFAGPMEQEDAKKLKQ